MTLLHRRLAARRRRNAFTLLEVLVVVAILVVLASVASIYVFRYLEDSKKDKAKLDIRAIDHAVKAYSIRNDGNPPDSLANLIQPPDGSKPFIEGGLDVLKDPWGKPYVYNPSGQGSGGEAQPTISCTAPDGTVISNVTK